MKKSMVLLLIAFSDVVLAQTGSLQEKMARLEYHQNVKDDKKAAELLTFRAMNYAALQVNKPERRPDAIDAVLEISRKIYPRNPGQVRLTLEGLRGQCNSAAALQEVEKLLRQIADFQIGHAMAHKGAVSTLFDGSTLNGWEGNTDVFRVVQGAIVGGSRQAALTHNEFLCTSQEYADFELSLQCKLEGDLTKANAGIQIRSQRKPDHYEMIGYQADMGQSYWGSLYDESRRNKVIAAAKPEVLKKALRKNGWNTYVIRCIGPRVQLWLNGVQTVDYVEADASLRQKGYIALQMHGGAAAQVHYKDITITEYPGDIQFRVHVIDSASAYEAGTIADLNNDGRLDLFCGGSWFSAPDWQKHRVRDVKALDGYHADFAAFPMDVDQDGWTDIVNGSWHDKNVFWVRNPGTAGGDFPVYAIDEPGNLETLVTADLNGDQVPDILPNTVSALVWYELKAAGRPGTWKKHELSKEAAGHGLGSGDINNDGKVDIVTQKGWLEQVDANADNWIWHPDFKLPSTSIPMLVHDVDEDGDSDIIYGLGHDYGLYWLEQTAKTNDRITWLPHFIDDTWSQPHFMLLVDLNNDGRKELVTGKRYYAHNGHDPGEDHPICVYYYEFKPSSRQWQRHVVHEGDRVGFGIYSAAADVDQDGDIDLLAPGKSGLYLLENLYK